MAIVHYIRFALRAGETDFEVTESQSAKKRSETSLTWAEHVRKQSALCP